MQPDHRGATTSGTPKPRNPPIGLILCRFTSSQLAHDFERFIHLLIRVGIQYPRVNVCLSTKRTKNRHLWREYLAVLETNHQTRYFFNLHHGDAAHTLMLGRTGVGKSFPLNFLITNLQRYDPYTFIFDLAGSFASLTKLFQGSFPNP